MDSTTTFDPVELLRQMRGGGGSGSGASSLSERRHSAHIAEDLPKAFERLVLISFTHIHTFHTSSHCSIIDILSIIEYRTNNT